MDRRRAAILLAACALAAAAPGCGDGDGARPPQGPSAARHGAQPLERLVALEDVRARLGAVGDLVALGRRDAAALHLGAARRGWERLEPAVAREDAVLAREITAAFAAVERELARASEFDPVRDRLAPLATQLLDGARAALLPRAARRDSTVTAEALIDRTRAVERAAAEAGRAGGVHAVAAHALAWALLVRSQALARALVDDLGPRRDAVVEGLKDARGVFPEGAAPPEEPLDRAELRARLDRVRAALRERFGLG